MMIVIESTLRLCSVMHSASDQRLFNAQRKKRALSNRAILGRMRLAYLFSTVVSSCCEPDWKL